MNLDATGIGFVVITLAAGAFLFLEPCGVHLPPKMQWLIGISLIVVFLWLLARLVGTISV